MDTTEDDDMIKVRAINASGTQNIVGVCKGLGCNITHISTDYVLDGQDTESLQLDSSIISY